MPIESYVFHTKNGLVLSTQNFYNGNVIYATGQHILLAEKNREAYLAGLADLELESGAFSRDQFNVLNTSVDDYLAAACVPEIAKRILYRLRTHFGFCDVKHSTFSLNFKQFMGRFLGFVQHCRISAGEFPGWLGQIIWAKSITRAADQPISNQDGWLQSALMILVYSRSKFRSKRCDNAIAYWVLKKTAPTAEIMKAYLALDEHPLIEAWRHFG